MLTTGQTARVDDYSALTGAYAIRLREMIGVKAAVAAPTRAYTANNGTDQRNMM